MYFMDGSYVQTLPRAKVVFRFEISFDQLFEKKMFVHSIKKVLKG